MSRADIGRAREKRGGACLVLPEKGLKAPNWDNSATILPFRLLPQLHASKVQRGFSRFQPDIPVSGCKFSEPNLATLVSSVLPGRKKAGMQGWGSLQANVILLREK